MPTALNNTLTKLASVTLGTGQTTISFTAIPQTYTDLVVKFSINSASNNQYIRFNNSSAAIYQLNTLRGNGATADNFVSGANQTELYFMASGIAADTFGSAELYIANYTSAIFKSCFLNAVGEANTATVYSNQIASSWNSTSAINQIDIVCASGLGQYSSATLYGINPVKTQALATGGDIVTNDGTYWYHAFLASGTFRPSTALSADLLVIAGGGGGGAGKGGGGGAGGVCNLSSGSFAANTNYSAVIGAGGAGGNFSGAPRGTNGSDTTFFGITGNGGGGGASDYAAPNNNGLTGGSGGGATRAGTVGAANQGTSGGATGFGFAGGLGINTNPYAGGGGGGSGGAGSAAQSTVAGGGGVGKSTWSSWLIPTGTGVDGFIAGGGGGAAYGSGIDVLGGQGGMGGGGAGGNYLTSLSTNPGTAGVVNTGSGGGGGADSGLGGAGGSGIVIIRYAMA